MKIAVSGASGFVGRHVVAELELRGISPVLICRPSTQRPEWFAGHADRTASACIETPPEVFDLIGRPDVMIHLAWGGLPHYKSLQHFERELPAHYRFLKQLVESGLGRLLVTGTCLEYGMQSGSLREDSETRPTTPYGFAKDALRRQLEYLRQTSPFEFTWARLFFLYGDGQAETSLLPQLQKGGGAGRSGIPNVKRRPVARLPSGYRACEATGMSGAWFPGLRNCERVFRHGGFSAGDGRAVDLRKRVGHRAEAWLLSISRL